MHSCGYISITNASRGFNFQCDATFLYYCWMQESLKKIYNFQYTNCVDLWVNFISVNVRDHDLQPLLYLVIQLISGVAHLFPGPRYLPLRLKCIQMLNLLSTSSGVFIPVASLALSALDYGESNKSNAIPKKNLNLSSLLKVWRQIKVYHFSVHLYCHLLHCSYPFLSYIFFLFVIHL